MVGDLFSKYIETVQLRGQTAQSIVEVVIYFKDDGSTVCHFISECADK